MVMQIEKVIGAVPGTLEPDTLYLVRTGAGFDVRVSDALGVTAHVLNLGGGGSGPINLDGGNASSFPILGLTIDGGGAAA